jgi:hypothetical protein
MIATEQKSAKVNWHSSIDFSSTTKPVPTPLPIPRMQEKACNLNQSEQEQSKQTLDVEEEDCQAVNVTDGFQKHDGALELKGNVGFNVQVNGKDAVSREEQAAIKIQQAFQGHLVSMLSWMHCEETSCHNIAGSESSCASPSLCP